MKRLWSLVIAAVLVVGPVAARADFMARIRTSNPDLGVAVESLINAHERRKACHNHAGQDRGDMRSLKSWMDSREDRRQQTIARHREEDARLAQLKDE